MTSSGSGAWTEPGAFEVAPGVHRVPLPLPNDGLRAVNVYVVQTDDGLVLVDAGWSIPESRTLLERALDQLRVLGAPALADAVAARTQGATVDRNAWELPDEWLLEGPIALAGGRTLDAVHTPGHTTGHLVFHDLAGGLLFAGDHVLPTITPSIGFEPVLSPDPLGAFLRSLALVRERPDALLLPAHGPVAPSVHARVDELLDFHGRRLEQTERAVARGAGTPYDIAGQLRWTRRERTLAELDPFNTMLAVFETSAHLVLLAAQGRVTRSSVDGVDHYSAS